MVSCALTEVQRGAAQVKVSADVPGLAAGARAEPTYGIGTVAQLVAALCSVRARVAAPAMIPVAGQLVAATVDSIEHGYGMDAAVI